MMKNKQYWPLVLPFLFLLAFIFIICFSESTSFLYDNSDACDSAIFQVIGKGWAHGKLPYVELWDSKGPIIFGMNALGYLLTGDRIGVSIIQILCLFVTFFFGYKILIQRYSVKLSLILSVFGCLSLLNVYDGGDNVEEFILPLLMSSFYFVYKWVHNNCEKSQYKHPFAHSFIYGAVLAFALLSRLTNAIGLCAAVGVIFVYLLFKNQWRNILLNVISFLLGFTILVLPFVIYFAQHGALHDMIYGSILYNIEYARTEHIDFSNPRSIVVAIKYNINALFLIGISVVILFKHIKNVSGWLWLLSASFLIAWLVNSSGYIHYSILLLPFFYISIVEVSNVFRTENRRIYNYALILICAVTFICDINIFRNLMKPDDATKSLQSYKAMITDIPQNEMSLFCAYNCEPYMYLYLNITPCYRFFILQDSASERGQSLAPQVKEIYESGKAKWILVQGNPKETIIADILSKHYNLAKEDKINNLRLYNVK